MKISRFLAAIFGALGVAAAVLCVFLSIRFMNAGPIMLKQSESAAHQVELLMDAVAHNDYQAAGALIYGNPDFGMNREPEGEVSKLIWDAYISSIRYELDGELYATESGVAQNIVITSLDISSVTEKLKGRSAELLEKRVAEAEDTQDVYDENNEYKEAFVMQVLYDAAAAVLEDEAVIREQRITVNMICEDGLWMIIGDSQLLSAISGGILK